MFYHFSISFFISSKLYWIFNNSLCDSLEKFKVEVFFVAVEEGLVVDVDEASGVTLAMDDVGKLKAVYITAFSVMAKLDTAVLWAWPETTAIPVQPLVILSTRNVRDCDISENSATLKYSVRVSVSAFKRLC